MRLRVTGVTQISEASGASKGPNQTSCARKRPSGAVPERRSRDKHRRAGDSLAANLGYVVVGFQYQSRYIMWVAKPLC